MRTGTDAETVQLRGIRTRGRARRALLAAVAWGAILLGLTVLAAPPWVGHALAGERSTPGSPGAGIAGAAPDPRADSGDAGAQPEAPLVLKENRQSRPRSAFTELLTAKQLGLGIVLMALAVATALGAFHALEPGHGKTVVAAYLVGSRGTAWHALVLGLVVTATHTAGVYLLGAVTLYASQYVVPERLYPWLGAFSGFTIAGLGFMLFLQRYAAASRPQTHGHPHGHHDPHGHHARTHGPEEEHAAHSTHHHPPPGEAVSLRQLVALGVSGGIVPCPAALVVLLSAVALRRVAFGLLLIVAFSVGLAAVLIAIGLLMVYARRLMSRFRGDGVIITRWLPLTSSAMITLLGVVLAIQALMAAGIVRIQLG